jgi:hypothetical protein
MFRAASGCATGSCVEVDLGGEDVAFKSAGKCASAGCVEVDTSQRMIKVRDSKPGISCVLEFTVPEWEAFIAGVKEGEFDLQR